jgi:hypothetical protein
MRLRKSVGTGLAVAALAVTAVAVAPGQANADNGDGLVACNSGEICLYRYDDAILWTKQFWYTQNHSGYKWWGGSPSNIDVQDDAVGITNRDTDCWVRIGNHLGNGNWHWQAVPNDHVRDDLIDAVWNRNDRHERCY